MKELPQSFCLIYGLTYLGLYPMVQHPFVSVHPFVHNNMSLCTVVMSTSDTKGCATMGYKPRWVNPYIKRKL